MPSVKRQNHSESQESTNQSQSPSRYDKRVQLAIPLRVISCDGAKRPQIDMACTLDISLRGARLYGVRPTMQVGEVVTVERGRNKFSCRVIWIGESDSPQKGQIGVQAMESGKCLWENEIREVSGQFGPINADASMRASSGDKKRKFQRLKADAQARVLPQRPGMPDGELASGRIKNISETGCLLTNVGHFEIGAHVQVVVDLPNSDVALRGRVRHVGPEGLGIEFREIRKSDRQLLRYWLHQMVPPAEEVPAVATT